MAKMASGFEADQSGPLAGYKTKFPARNSRQKTYYSSMWSFTPSELCVFGEKFLIWGFIVLHNGTESIYLMTGNIYILDNSLDR